MRRALSLLLTAVFAPTGAGFYVLGHPRLAALTPLGWLAVYLGPIVAWKRGALAGHELLSVGAVALPAYWLLLMLLTAGLPSRPERRPRVWITVLASAFAFFVTTAFANVWLLAQVTLLTVPAAGMAPTLQPGDSLVVRVRDGEPVSPGQVVAFRRPGDAAMWAQRVVATEGQTVEIAGGELKVDGVVATAGTAPLPEGLRDAACVPLLADRAVPETLGPHRYLTLRTSSRALPDFREVTVPPHSLFVLGDNRDEARDSRLDGYVSVDDVVGFVDSRLPSGDRCGGPARPGQVVE